LLPVSGQQAAKDKTWLLIIPVAAPHDDFLANPR
jgi:hypothetical protein